MRKLSKVFSLLLLLSMAACLKPPTPQEMLVGTWESVEIESETGNAVGMTFSYQADGSFSAIMEMSDGSEMPLTGQYRVIESNIIFTYTVEDGQEPLVDEMTYIMEDGLLTIFDTRTSGWGKFKKIK